MSESDHSKNIGSSQIASQKIRPHQNQLGVIRLNRLFFQGRPSTISPMLNNGFILSLVFGWWHLGAPAQLLHNSPDMTGMIADTGKTGDELGDTRQTPKLTIKAIGCGTFEQGRFNPFQLQGRKPRFAPGPARYGKRFFASLLPAGEPGMDGLPRYTQLASNIRLGHAFLKKSRRHKPPLPHLSQISSGRITRWFFYLHSCNIAWSPKLSPLLCEIL